MSDGRDIIIGDNRQLAMEGLIDSVPLLFRNAGEDASRRFIEFFTANIRNKNTRFAYGQAVKRFVAWCERHKLELDQLSPPLIAAYIEEVGRELSVPSTKQHLAAIRMLFDYLVVGHGMVSNPATSVRGPRHSMTTGKTPVLTPDEARQFLDSIDTTTVVGLRDKALVSTMIYSFARISAVLSMNVDDFYADASGRRYWLRLHEKNGKEHCVPAHHNADAYLHAYIEAAGLGSTKDAALFRSMNRQGELTDRRLTRREALAMVKRRARKAGLNDFIGNHSFRASGITAYLLNGGTLEHAQQIAAHSSARTTKLYDRTRDQITLDEIERIAI